MNLDSTARENQVLQRHGIDSYNDGGMDVSMGRKTGSQGRVCCLDYSYYYWAALSVDHSSMQAGGGAVGTR